MKTRHANILSSFIQWLTMKGYKVRGIEEKERNVTQYCAYAETHDIDIYSVTINDAEDYREYMRFLHTDDGAQRYDARTINCKLRDIRVFYQYLISCSMSYTNPFISIERMKESETVPTALFTVEQMETLLNNLPLQTRSDIKFAVIIELLYSTGMRIGEVETLTREEIRLDDGYIIIEDDKSRQDRRSPLTEYCCELLDLYLSYGPDEGPTVFYHGKPKSLNVWLNNRLKRLTKKLDLPHISCHGIRHSIATHLLRNGADIREVQEYLGHRALRNTEVYTRIFPDDLKKTIDTRHPRESGDSHEYA